MIAYILVCLAAVCNAVMDTISFHHNISIFSRYNPNFWNPEISWKNKYVDWDNYRRLRKRFFFHWFVVPAALTDAWHLFKSLMIIFLVLAIVLYQPVFGILYDFVGLGLLWNISFLLCYNKFFMRSFNF